MSISVSKFPVFRRALVIMTSQVVLVVKKLPAYAGDIRDVGLIPGSGRSPEEGNGNLFHYSCLENPMERGACQGFLGSQRVGHI